MDTLTYAGKSLADFGVFFDSSQIFNKSEKMFNTFSIPNRNGSLLSSLKKYDNIEIAYNCFVRENFASNFNDLIDYLTSFETYQKLENSVEPDTYRMAVFRADINANTGSFLKDGKFTLVFYCKPQNFYNSGDTWTKLAVNTVSNVWSDSTFNLAGIVGTYSNGVYQLQGNVNTVGSTYRQVNISIPSSGTWDIQLTVEYANLPYGITMSANNVSSPLQWGGAIIASKTTTGASSFPFRIDIPSGTYGTVDAIIKATLSKRNSATELVNPSRKEAKPLFMFENISSNATAFLNGQACFVYNTPGGVADSDGTLYIDCELMDCYMLDKYGTVHNYNPNVTFFYDFPTLSSGTTSAMVSTGNMYIQPRWWRL